MSLHSNYAQSAFSSSVYQEQSASFSCSTTDDDESDSGICSTTSESDHAMDASDGEDEDHVLAGKELDDFANSIEICFVAEGDSDDDGLSMNIERADRFEAFSWNSDNEKQTEAPAPKAERPRRLSFFESVSVVTFEKDEPPHWIQYNKHEGQLTLLSHIHKSHPPQDPKSLWCSLRSLHYRQPCHIIGKITALRCHEDLAPIYVARVSFDKWQTFVDVNSKNVSYSACDRFLYYEFCLPLEEEVCFDGDIHFELIVYSTRTPSTIEFMDDCHGEKYLGHIELKPVPCEGLRPLKGPAQTKSLDKMLCDSSYVLSGHVFQL